MLVHIFTTSKVIYVRFVKPSVSDLVFGCLASVSPVNHLLSSGEVWSALYTECCLLPIGYVSKAVSFRTLGRGS